jgi:poly-beta-1,6-N-acetyl-D-glucosamine synthase
MGPAIISYIIITPVKDESEFIKYTLESIIMQTILPALWIIVDDGSTDNTLEIAKEYAAKYDWIKVIQKPTQEEKRMGGSKVVKAFNEGLKQVGAIQYDYMVKLDGDLTLPSNYFEKIFYAFKEDDNLGICGGIILNKYTGGKLIEEKADNYEVRGAFKTIRKECWKDIGGFKEVWFWDGLDLMEARFHGWDTKSLDIPVIHHRPTSSAYNPVKHSFKSGYESFKLGSNVFLTMLRSGVRMKKKPYLIVGISFFIGYIYALIRKEPVLVSPELASFIRKFHYSRFHKILGIRE